MARVGVLGGSFDPPHRGHLAMARLAMARVPLDRVLLAPLNAPCHKAGPHASYEHRCAMARRLVAGVPGLEVSDVDGRLGGLTYTWRTLEALAEGPCRGDELFFLMGADSMEEFHTWRRPERILELARPVALARPGHVLRAAGLTPGQAARFLVVRGLRSRCSSTAVRAQLAARGWSPGVPAEVLAYLRGAGLYGVTERS